MLSLSRSCKDEYGDGWHGGFIEFDNKRYCDDFTLGHENSTQVTVSGNTGNYFDNVYQYIYIYILLIYIYTLISTNLIYKF